MTSSTPRTTEIDDPLRRLARYAGSTLALRVLRLAYAYVKPKFLAPAQLGLWNLLNLIPIYGAYLHLGSRNALEFRLPKLLSEGRTAEAETIVGSVYYAALAGNSLVATTLLALATFGGFDEQTSFGLAAMAPAMLLVWYNDQQLGVLKAEQRFSIIANANLLKAASLLTLSVPLVVLWGFEGACVGFVLSHTMPAIYLKWRSPLSRVGSFDRSVFIDLVKEGAPVLAFASGLTLLNTTDSLVIGSMLGLSELGFYSLAIVTAGFAMQVPLAARDMLEPRLMASLSRSEAPQLWRQYLLLPQLNLAAYFPFLVGVLAFLADDILALILPKYLPSAIPAVVLTGGCYFLAQMHVARGILVANRWQARVVPFLLAGVGLHVAMSMTFINQGWGIVGVAASSSIAFAVTMSATFVYTLNRSPLAVREWGPVFLTIFGAPAGSLALIFALSQFAPPGEVALLPSLAGAILFVVGQAAWVGILRRVFPSITPLPLPWRRRS